jgi:cbb3-type cytochrome c oxidase subunit III
MSSPRSLVHLAVLLALAVAFAPAVRAAENARGAELFQLCAQCHGSAGEGNHMALAPNIAGMPDWYLIAQLQNFKTGARGTHPEDVGGLRMYPMSQTLKTDDDVKAVAAYVAALPLHRSEPTLTGGDPARGAQFYAVCQTCHGPDGSGMQPMGSPRIAGQADWYLLSSLQKFKAGTRGTYPNAAVMRGMAGTLPEGRDRAHHVPRLGHRGQRGQVGRELPWASSDRRIRP